MLCYCYYVIIYSEFNKKPFGWLDLLNVCQTIINLLVCFGFCLNENTLKTENSTLLLLLNIYIEIIINIDWQATHGAP